VIDFTAFLFSIQQQVFNIKNTVMQLRKSERKQARIKMALQGPSGSGKTYSALLVAFGLCQDWSKIAVVDTESHSADLYAHLGAFNVLTLEAPYSPERYIEAIRVCVQQDMSVVIIDSISHEWEGSGGILDVHSSMAGNSFANWSKLTPRHNEFVQEILQSPAHIIATIRTKQDYVLSDKNGRMVPEKVGLKSVTRDGMDYEFTLVFDLDIKNRATASKDRTGLFMGKPEQRLSTQTGKVILDWCNESQGTTPAQLTERIGQCKSIQELLELYQQHPEFKNALKPEFEQRKREILIQQHLDSKQIHNPKPSSNGKL
jgi:hypothetical protein